MQQEFNKYLRSLLKYAGFVILVAVLVNWLFTRSMISSYFFFIFAFFLLINVSFHLILLKITFGKPAESFVGSYLMFMGFKFLAYITGAAIAVFALSPPAILFSLCFFLTYAAFAIFEIRYLVKYNINKQSS